MTIIEVAVAAKTTTKWKLEEKRIKGKKCEVTEKHQTVTFLMFKYSKGRSLSSFISYSNCSYLSSVCFYVDIHHVR